MSYNKNMKTILVDAINCFVLKTENSGEVFQEMYDLLETYPNKKIVLTSANDEQFEKYNLVTVPYELFTLKHEPEKMDPKYYEILLEKYGLSKDEVIYFEHDEEAVRSAESVGIKSYHYDKDKKDLEALKKFLDENLDV
jgi:FMN phosphatase YigB (HAD superfamily)